MQQQADRVRRRVLHLPRLRLLEVRVV
jgi:hypothetical protein